MNIGTICGGEVNTERGAVVIAALGMRAGGVGAEVPLRLADGAGRTERVAVEDNGLGCAELIGAVGVGNVGGVAPAQPAKITASAIARASGPARDRPGGR